jgi:hypothetical protein
MKITISVHDERKLERQQLKIKVKRKATDIFIDVIKQIQSTTYIKIRDLDTPATLTRSEKEKVVYARQQYAKLESGEKTRSIYIKSMNFKFAARTDL